MEQLAFNLVRTSSRVIEQKTTIRGGLGISYNDDWATRTTTTARTMWSM
jgi:hypothetical protein